MTDDQSVTKKRKNKTPRGFSRKTSRRFPLDFKLRAVKMHLEEGFSYALITEELDVSDQTVMRWVARYRRFGEVGLHDLKTGPGQPHLPDPVRDKIIELKKAEPTFGIKRISQLLRRWFFLPASPETVRRHLHAAELMPESSPPKKRNLTRPRFFERATPNQMWQSDIFTFRLGGRYAYLIAFMDDYSRFIVGADLFRSPTAAAVIEVYRVAVGEFQPPKEMLTDNGRQYTTWRGVSRFEAELKKDRVAHFKSRPQHPMTLGKIERFWSTLWQDFLVRAQFDSFDAARERIKLWIKYYNHKRPHQGIEGLCPADRFFGIQNELRKTIEAGIQQNLLELALRGKPQAPFYMVGRMDGQSVVLRAEKGKLKLSVSDQNNNPEQELTYDLHQDRKDGTQETNAHPTAQCPGQSPGGAGGVDGALQAGGCLPPVEHQMDHLQSMAAAGDGGHAPSAGVSCEPEQGRSPESAFTGVAPTSPTDDDGGTPDQPIGTVAQQGCQPGLACGKNGVDECQSQTTGGGDLQGALRSADRDGSGASTGHLPPAILPMGTTGLAGSARGAGEPAHRPAQEPNGPGEGGAPTPGATTRATGLGTSATGTAAPAPAPVGTAGGPATR